jgi:hypothetical protein
MSKEELKIQYRSGKLDAKQYFLALARVIKGSATVAQIESPLDVFDGNLPLI